MKRWMLWSLTVLGLLVLPLFVPAASAAVEKEPTRYYLIHGGGAVFSEMADVQGAMEDLEDFGVSPYISIGAGIETKWARFEAAMNKFVAYDMRFRRTLPVEDAATIVVRNKRHGAAWNLSFMAYYDHDVSDRISLFAGAGPLVTLIDTYPDDGLRFGYSVAAGVSFELIEDYITAELAYRRYDFDPFGGRVDHGNNGAEFRIRVNLSRL